MKNGQKIIGFICNWSAYSAIDAAGVNRSEYPAALRLMRLPCLARLEIGMVLKAFERGADGVLVLGCPSGDCRHNLGPAHAREVLAQSRKLLTMLGVERHRLAYVELPAGAADLFIEKVSRFIGKLDTARREEVSLGESLEEAAVCRR